MPPPLRPIDIPRSARGVLKKNSVAFPQSPAHPGEDDEAMTLDEPFRSVKHASPTPALTLACAGQTPRGQSLEQALPSLVMPTVPCPSATGLPMRHDSSQAVSESMMQEIFESSLQHTEYGQSIYSVIGGSSSNRFDDGSMALQPMETYRSVRNMPWEDITALREQLRVPVPLKSRRQRGQLPFRVGSGLRTANEAEEAAMAGVRVGE